MVGSGQVTWPPQVTPGEALPLPLLPKAGDLHGGQRKGWPTDRAALAEATEGFWDPPESPLGCVRLQSPAWQGQALQIWGPAQHLELRPRWAWRLAMESAGSLTTWASAPSQAAGTRTW